MLATQERQRLKYLSNLGKGRKRKNFVGNLRLALKSGAQTDRTHHSIDYDGIDPARLALAKVSEHEMQLLVDNRRPPGTVRKVFTALMILVSPFETSEADVQWTAVQEWVDQLGGVAAWLHNLWNFNIGLVPVGNATKCQKYIVDSALFDDQLRIYSPCLANFLRWIQEVCASAQAMSTSATSRASFSADGRRALTDRGSTQGSMQKGAEPNEFNNPIMLSSALDGEAYSDDDDFGEQEFDEEQTQEEPKVDEKPPEELQEALKPVPPPGKPAAPRPSSQRGSSRPGSEKGRARAKVDEKPVEPVEKSNIAVSDDSLRAELEAIKAQAQQAARDEAGATGASEEDAAAAEKIKETAEKNAITTREKATGATVAADIAEAVVTTNGGAKTPSGASVPITNSGDSVAAEVVAKKAKVTTDEATDKVLTDLTNGESKAKIESDVQE